MFLDYVVVQTVYMKALGLSGHQESIADDKSPYRSFKAEEAKQKTQAPDDA